MDFKKNFFEMPSLPSSRPAPVPPYTPYLWRERTHSIWRENMERENTFHCLIYYILIACCWLLFILYLNSSFLATFYTLSFIDYIHEATLLTLLKLLTLLTLQALLTYITYSTYNIYVYIYIYIYIERERESERDRQTDIAKKK